MTKFTFAQREEGFDNHIEKSIRGYVNLWDDILKMSEYFVDDYSNVVDVGCSTGKLLKAMIAQNTFAPHAQYCGIEVEEDFFKTYDADEKAYNNLKYHRGDVRSFQFDNCNLVTSIFTLQFIPEIHRTDIIRQIYDGLNVGGAFIFAEKTAAENSRIHEIRTFTYYDYKRQNFTSDDILDKEKQLRHMMKLNTRTELVNKCATAGFSFNKIESFWQNFGFTGFIAIK